MREVHILAKAAKIDITVEMGDGPAALSNGLGGWKTVERVDDLSFTAWEGQEPLSQDVPILLDGWGRNPKSVQADLNTILKLGRDFDSDDRSAPPVFKMWGPVFFEGKNWVLPDGGIDLNTDDTIRLDDGTLVRQSLVLHCLEFVKPDVIGRRKKSKGVAKKPGGAKAVAYTTVSGDTFLKIANREYGEWEKWEQIANKNPKYIHDPFTHLPPGRTLTL